MAEVAELLHPEDAEDEEFDDDDDDDDEADPWPLPSSSASAFDSETNGDHDRGLHLDHGGGRDLPALHSDISVPVFSPQLCYFSSSRLDHPISLDSGSESSFVDEQVSLALDLFDRSCPRCESVGGGGGAGMERDPIRNDVDPFSYGVFERVEDMGSDYLELGLGLGLEEPKEGEAGGDLEEDEGLDLGRDVLFVGWSSVVLSTGKADAQPSRSPQSEGLRIVALGSDSDSEAEDDGESMMRMQSDSEFDQDHIFDNFGFPLCWNCLRIEDGRRGPSDDFDWEEVEGRVNETDALGTVMDADHGSIVPEEANTDLELEEGEEETVQNVEWEVLAVDALDRNAPVENEDSEFYLGEEHDDGYNSEYEILFEQFGENEHFMKGSPPAAKLVIERLPSVVLTQVDVANNNTLCAVCKDEISLEEKAKQLPCSHHYHAECILPWLRIRNTCPVCRYELPTDDPHYEDWRARRAGIGGAVEGFQVRYDFEIFPEEQGAWE